MSEHEYAECQRLKARSHRVYASGELPDDRLATVVSAQMRPEHEHLNALMDEENSSTVMEFKA
ncbi:hypothetical protein BH10CHL1_BH10CHL1_30770 [soil metagenome]